MISPFTLHRPNSVGEASSLLSELKGDARILAGGSELILLLKMGLAEVSHIVDIKRIPGLAQLDYDAGARRLKIGPLVTHRELEKSEIVRQHFPLIVEMEKQLANVRIRNVGTLAGNLSFAEPHADPGTLLVAHDATVKLANGEGERVLNLEDFFVDYYETVLRNDELLMEITVPKPAENSFGAYLRFCPGERPMVVVAFVAEWHNGVCAKPRLVLGCVGPKPLRAAEAEAWITGKSREEIQAGVDDLGVQAAKASEPLEDIWGSVEYKKQIVKTLVARAILSATQQPAGHG
jgi:aerobic carbon-monoxide dehydrogenase medium subunit